MRLKVNVHSEGERPLPEGAIVRAEVRDTSFADALPEVVAATSGIVEGSSVSQIEGLILDVNQRPDAGVVWIHVDVNGDGRVSRGDFVSMQAYPLPDSDDADLEVLVREV